MNNLFASFFFLLIGIIPGSIFAAGNSVDCTDVSVNYADDANLTRAEKLARMDKALTDSLNRFELCQQEALNKTKGSSSANSGEGAQSSMGGEAPGEQKGNSNGADSGTNNLDSQVESVASSELSGTEQKAEENASSSASENYQEHSKAMQEGSTNNPTDSNKQNAGGSKTMSSDNGKTPDDIPSANNDDTLAAQIRYAAENETDPERKKMLWNEYRKYKGLPTQ